MNAHVEIQDIATVIETNPVSALLDESVYDRLIAHIKAEIEAFEPDLSTATSRKEIGSLAYKVKRTKTAIDDAGKKLNEDARAKINAVDEKRRQVRADLDELSALARKPLTDWEAQEEARIEYCTAILKAIEDAGNGIIRGESSSFDELFDQLENKIVIDAQLGEFEDQARIAHKIALDRVRAAYEEKTRLDAERAELEQLRAEKAERDRIEAERLEKERLAKEAAEHEQAEKERQAKAEAEYKANVARAAEEARQAEAAKAKAEQDRIEREAAEKVAAAEAEARAIKEKAEREERERLEAIEQTKREEAARQADRDHRGKIMGEAKASFMKQGLDEETSRRLVLAIVAGHVANVHMEF